MSSRYAFCSAVFCCQCSSEDSLRVPMQDLEGFKGAGMRRIQRRPLRKNSFCPLLNPQVTIAARLAISLFPPHCVPGEYDQSTLKFPIARKQAAFSMRVVFVLHCSPAPLNNSRPVSSGGISKSREFAPPDFRLPCRRHAGGKL